MPEFRFYNREVLKGRQFRLLFIYPTSDDRQPIECRSLIFELDTAPSYEALSYVWGVQSPTTEVNFNGSPMEVGPSLADALTRLRLPSSTRIVWIDALCINQKDNKEKNHQVPLMGSIYSLARRVVVWLGHENPVSCMTAKEIVLRIGIACKQYDFACRSLTKDGERYDGLDIPAEMFSPDILHSLKQLFGRQWFTRIWCVQEICLAQEAVILYGDVEMPWAAVGLTASWIFAKTTKPGKQDELSLSLRDILSDNADVMHDKDLRGSLLEVLQYFREFEASDPRDRVYGLLNLVTEEREVETLGVDYDKTTGQVYADTTLVIIRLYAHLTTLAWVFHPEDYHGTDGIRSWAPVWNDPNPTSVLGYPEESCPWSACGNNLIQSSHRPYIGYDHLRLSGIFHDTVIDVHNTMTTYSLRPNPGEQHPFVVTARVLQDLDASLERKGQEHSRKLARTLTAGEANEAKYIHSLDFRAQESFYNAFAKLLKWLTYRYPDNQEDAILKDEDDGTDSASDNAEEYVTTLDSETRNIRSNTYHTCSQRRIFLLRNNSYGLGPQCMRTGDIVVVLYGGNTPYILRPTGDKYLFMGQAYVDEIMQGELVQEVHSGHRQEQEFCII